MSATPGAEFFIWEDEKAKGPYTAAEIWKMIGEGLISHKTLFAEGADGTWGPIGDEIEIFYQAPERAVKAEPSYAPAYPARTETERIERLAGGIETGCRFLWATSGIALIAVIAQALGGESIALAAEIVGASATLGLTLYFLAQLLHIRAELVRMRK